MNNWKTNGMDNGQLTMDSEQWIVNNEQLIMNNAKAKNN
jgi:hypothetical protein